jgi:hypothetical protein
MILKFFPYSCIMYVNSFISLGVIDFDGLFGLRNDAETSWHITNLNSYKTD